MNNEIMITYYKNRKLYSNTASRYVNLKECKELIDAGFNVKFVSHVTKEDVTEQCLKEMLCKFSVSQDILIRLIKRSKEE